MVKKIIGIIGFGYMGQSIASQLKNDYKIFIFDKDKEKTKNFPGLENVERLGDLINSSSCLILAVKPQDYNDLLKQIKNLISPDKLIISIAAGITTKHIENALGITRVVRTMPNLPARVASGMTCLCKGQFATEEDFDFTENLFDYLGETLRISEELMPAATAVSGSGPAYVCNYLETNSLDVTNIPLEKKKGFLSDFQQAAENLGFNSADAEFLVNTTFAGTVNFIKKTGISSVKLIEQVASKGGTTEAAFKVLKRNGSLKQAVMAARDRAEELAKGGD